MWFHAILGNLSSTFRNSARAGTRRPTSCLEPLEKRALLSGNTVDRLGDAGTGGVRGEAALATLPEAEGEQWRNLRTDVKNTLAIARRIPSPQQKSQQKP
jgi:hypothetical protein